MPCLGALDAGLLAYIEKRRLPTSLHGSTHCAHCEHAPRGETQFEVNRAAVAALRAAAAEDWLAVVTDVGERNAETATKPEATVGRRQLFRRLLGRGANEISTLIEGMPQSVPAPDQAIRPGAYALTGQRELLQIVAARKDGPAFTVEPHDALAAVSLHLASGCTACEACFRVCPTGAIGVVENPGDWALVFQIDRCVGCLVCLEACQPRVLGIKTHFDLTPDRPARPLLEFGKQRCTRCDRSFVSASTEEICRICDDDKDAFASIFG